MYVLAISTNTGDPAPYIAAEAQAIDSLIEEGVVERVLLKADFSGAVLLLNAPDEATAQATVDALPIAAHGLTRFTLVGVTDPAAALPGMGLRSRYGVAGPAGPPRPASDQAAVASDTSTVG